MTPQERFFLFACFLLTVSIFCQFYFMVFFDNTLYSPDQGSVINFSRVAFQICGMLSSVGLFIVSSLMLITLRLEKALKPK